MSAVVSEVRIEGLKDISHETAKEVAGIRAGDVFTSSLINKSVDNLKKWGVFEDIQVREIETSSGVEVLFHLTEAEIVASIDITGNYPYLENKIRKYLSLHPGDIYSKEKAREQIDKIREFYVKEGFVGTEVFVDEENLPEWGGVILTFHIHRGNVIRVRNIEVEGNFALPEGRFVSILNPYRHFSEKKLSDSLRKIRDIYRNKGYPRARVKVVSKQIDTATNHVDLKLLVNEGPKVDVIFKGAYYVTGREMRKSITIFKEGSYDDYEVEQSVEALKTLFRDRGYPDAIISSAKETRPDDTVVITFSIDEGISRRIKRVRFTGNENVGRKKLEKEMKNRPVSLERKGAYYPEDVPEDNNAIQTALKRDGYIDSRVGQWEVKPTKQGYALDITIPIEEGQQTWVSEISFNGDLSFTIPELIHELKIKPGKPLDVPDLETDRRNLATFYLDNGHPYAEVRQSWTRNNDGYAIINYDISAGPEVRIGKILYFGDVMTSQKALSKAMNIHEGNLFSYRKIIESELNIRRLGPFASVNIETIGLDDKERTVHLKVKVEEQRPFMVDMELSYSTYEMLSGTLSFVNVNAFGWAKTNSLKLTGGQKLSRAEIGWADPRFLSSSFEMNATAWLQYQVRPAYRYTQLGGSIGWMRRLRRFNFMFRYELDRDYFIEGDTTVANADSLNNNVLSQVSLSSSYDSRDSFSNPQKGFYTMGGVDIFNEIKGNQSNFVQFTWKGENEETLLRRFTLSTGLRFDRIQSIGSNVVIPINQLLFLGGTDTIRGFSEDDIGPQNAAGQPVGGTTRWIWNEELRIRLWRAFQLALFLDMGSLTDTFSAITPSTIRSGAGFGLRYITPVGPMRVEYAFKLDRRSGESLGHFHFTFGYVF